MKKSVKMISVMLSSTLLITSIIVSGCEAKKEVTEYPVTLEQVLTETNERDKSIVDNFKIDNASDYYFNVDMDGFTEAELEKLFSPGHMTSVKPEKAKKDINVLFRLLQGSYSGYAYFGGAQVFDQAKKDMLTEIESYGDRTITTVEFTKLIRDHLDFVIDDHLLIGSVNLGFDEAYCWYDNNSYEYQRDSIGYYTIIEDAKWYLSENMIDYLEYTIGKSGEIVYGLFFVGTDKEQGQLPLHMTLTNKKEEKNIEIKWEKSVSQSIPSSEYELRDTQGFKTAVIAAFSATQNTNIMINDAKTLAKEDYAIVDLRYNMGGLVPDVTMWMYNFTGKEIYPKWASIAYDGVVNNYWHGLIKSEVLALYKTFDFYEDNPELFNNMVNNVSDVYTVTKVANGIRRFDYDTQWTQHTGKVLFLLDGKENVSAGEIFIEDSRSLENTLVVGTNSGGCLTTGDVNSTNVLYLPNSQIGIIYSSVLTLFDRPKDFDKYGILPDIYIGTGNAAEAVARCIRYYQ